MTVFEIVIALLLVGAALALALFVAPVLLDAAFDASPRDLREHRRPPVRAAEPGDRGYWRAVEQGDAALADAIVVQIACEHFSREP